ncbi:MAG: amidohydrolase family protein [Anaerotruncus massiliensis (ex Togo et al. 2019)]
MKTILYQNADWILTMDGDRRRYRHGDLLISGNEIVDVGERLAEKHRATTPIDEVVDASGRVILPGFVNVHHHTWQSLIRNINVANGLVLEPWLQVMFEIFKDLTPEVARAGVYAGLGDALKTGCTTSNDLFYPHPVEGLVEATILAAEEIGIRFHPNRGFESLASNIVPPEIISAPEEIIADTERLVKRYHDPSRFSMCRVGVAPSMPQYGTPACAPRSTSRKIRPARARAPGGKPL